MKDAEDENKKCSTPDTCDAFCNFLPPPAETTAKPEETTAAEGGEGSGVTTAISAAVLLLSFAWFFDQCMLPAQWFQMKLYRLMKN